MFVSFRNSLHVLLEIILLSIGFSRVQGASMSGDQNSSSDTARFITWTYNQTPMGLYVPASTGKPLPVVMYLHYCSGNPLDAEFWIIPALNAIEPCAVFLPTAPEALDFTCADWGGTYDAALRPNMVNALHEFDSLIGEFGFDTKRQYLYGESMGGEGVYRLLVDFPSRFAGAVSVVGYTLNKGADKMAQTPLWIIHGSDDGTSPVENDRAIYKAIIDAGGTEVKYSEYPGLDHVPAMNQAHTEPSLITWLLDHQRSTAISQFSKRRADVSNNKCFLSYTAGKLRFSNPLHHRTTVALFAINGKMIYKAITSEEFVILPSGIANRVALWRLWRPEFSTSGKFLSVHR